MFTVGLNCSSKAKISHLKAKNKLINIKISSEEYDKIVNSGLPFMTSGCPSIEGDVACNRPFANEKPGKLIRNYPFIPNKSDIKFIKKQFQVDCLR